MQDNYDFWIGSAIVILSALTWVVVRAYFIYLGLLGTLMVAYPPLLPIAKANRGRILVLIIVFSIIFSGSRNKMQVCHEGIVEELTKIRKNMELR